MSDKIAAPALPEEDFAIKILRDGTWLHRGRPILRHNLVKLFATVLRRDEKGDFWLQTPVERGRIDVEDAPFVAVEMRQEASESGQNLLFRTNVDDWVRLDAEHGLRFGVDPQAQTPVPYIHIRGGLEARILRSVYYELAALAVPDAADPDLYGVHSGGGFFALGRGGDEK
jgi:uncharacterized protein